MTCAFSSILRQCACIPLACLSAICLGAAAEIDDAALKAADGLRLVDDFVVLRGAVNTGVLVHGGTALLFDACDSVTSERLALLGVRNVDAVYFTQFRRPNTAGGYALAENGATLHGPAGERDFFEKANEYWADDRNHWHVYEFRPGMQVPARSMPLAGVVRGGDHFEWNGHAVSVLDTPGMTDGALSYKVSAGDKTWLFCGDVMSAPGQIWDLYSLQKAVGTWDGYTGFLGGSAALRNSLDTIRDAAPSEIIPSHGRPFPFSNDSCETLKRRLADLWINYVAVAGLNFWESHLPEYMASNQEQMPPSPTMPLPDWIQHVAGSSFLVSSKTGHALLIDCGNFVSPGAVGVITERQKTEGTIVDACWLTHYHEDHSADLDRLAAMGIPILCDASTACIVENPERYLLPCLSSHAAAVARVMSDGETCKWQEFSLTAFHFPGQTLYHGGLLLEGNGKQVFFAGDSVSPKGLHDQCPGNRNFLGPGVGLRRCLDILRQTQPDYVLGQHVPMAFAFTAEQLDYMDSMLARRQELIEEMTPRDNANFALDEHWVRSTPYEQEVVPGQAFVLEVEFTNHGDHESHASAEAVLPSGWRTLDISTRDTVIPAKTCGLRIPSANNSDGHLTICMSCPADAPPGLQVIPVRIWWDGQYLGQAVTALVRVRGNELRLGLLVVFLGMIAATVLIFRIVATLMHSLARRLGIVKR